MALMEKAGVPLSIIDYTFASQSSFVYGDTAQNADIPSAIGMPTAQFGSYQSILSAFSTGLLPGSFRAVIYDNEHWGYTPLSEQQNPAYYEQQTAQLLHAHGLLYIAAPAPDLMWAVGRPADSYQAFLGANMAASAARYADIYDIQGQQKESDLPYFTWFVRTAAAQARSANPHVRIFVGLRTDPGSQTLLAAYEATAGIADGYWLNVNGIPGPANDLLYTVDQNIIDQTSPSPAPDISQSAGTRPSSSHTWMPSPSGTSPTGPTSSPSESPSSAQVNGTYPTTGTQVAVAAANRRASKQMFPGLTPSPNMLGVAPAAAFVLPLLVLPLLAVLYGMWRWLKTARHR